MTIATMFTIQTAVTIVTAGLANSIFGDIISVEIWTLIISLLSFSLLLIGKYKTLDKLIKYLIIALTISTHIILYFCRFEFEMNINFNQTFPIDTTGIIFLIAFMGWMPAPLDVSIWNSIWALEKKKTIKNYSLKNSMFDFNLGYFGTAILGVCFICLGYFVMYGTGETFSESAGAFSNQLIHLYTDNLGYWSYYLIALQLFQQC